MFKIKDKVRLNTKILDKRMGKRTHLKDKYVYHWYANYKNEVHIILNIDNVWQHPYLIIPINERGITIYLNEDEILPLKPYKRIIKNIVKNM